MGVMLSSVISSASSDTKRPSWSHVLHTLCHVCQMCTERSFTYRNYFLPMVAYTFCCLLREHEYYHTIQHIKHNTASFLCAPTEIINIVKSGNASKSSGVDNIDPYVVQKSIPQIENQLAHVFNKSLQTGIVPDKLKIAKVIPLYKNDNPEQFKNYRPISILPCFSKIIERIMYNRLYSFLTKHNIISEKQLWIQKKICYIYGTNRFG